MGGLTAVAAIGGLGVFRLGSVRMLLTFGRMAGHWAGRSAALLFRLEGGRRARLAF